MHRATPLRPSDVDFLARQRVAHLATANSSGQPHVVPVCFVLYQGFIWVSLDAKPKRVDVTRLKRVRNIQENPVVALIVDDYDEDWRKLAYLLVHGRADLRAVDDADHPAVVASLRAKYPQYQLMPIDCQPTIRIVPTSVARWAWRGWT